jgi:membrane protease subunit HflK
MVTTSRFENPWDNKKKRGKDELDDIIKKGQQRLINFLNQKGENDKKGGGGGGNFEGPDLGLFLNQKILVIIGLVLLVMWLSTGFYTVQPDEEAVVMRFGKYSRTSPSGLNYKLPYPVETVTIVSVTRVNKEEIGFRSNGKKLLGNDEHFEQGLRNESKILTTDENIVDINCEIQWVIVDAKKFLFNVRDLYNENTVKITAESAMREIIGLSTISNVLAEERSKSEQDAKTLMQKILDSYDMGVKVVRVQLLRVDPPVEVIDAYRDVQNAKQDKEKEINQALTYRNDIIPRARGEAEKILQEAEGYKKQVIANAQGETQRFSAIYEQYKNAKDVTRKRIYLETMEQILDGMEKIIVDKGSANNMVPYLPLNELMKNKKAKEVTTNE